MHQVFALIFINDQSELNRQRNCLFLSELYKWCILTTSKERELLNSFVSEIQIVELPFMENNIAVYIF